MILKECLTILNYEGSLKGWTDKYQFDTDENILKSFSEITSKINYTVTSFYEKLNLSLLSGEYLEHKKFNDIYEEVKKKLDDIQYTIEHKQPEIQEQLTFLFLESFIKPCKNSILGYKGFSDHVERRLDNSELIVLIEAFRSENSSIPQEFKTVTEVFELAQLFKNNLSISQIDHDFSMREVQLRKLLLIRRELEISKRRELDYVKINIDKCSYLIKKIVYRFKKKNRSFQYAFDHQPKELDFDDLKIEYFKKFDQDTRVHYDIDSEAKNIRSKELKSFYESIRRGDSISYKMYHTAVKHYKDDLLNFSQVHNLNEKFIEKFKARIREQNIFSFDKYALHVICNYMHNNEFSITLEQDKIELSIAENCLDSIINIQTQSGIKNYFPFYKFCKYLESKIEEKLKSNIELKGEDSEHLKILLKKFKINLDTGFNYLLWCKERFYRAFQLPFKECILKQEIDGKTYNLFLASSFVLPLDYTEIEKEFSNLYLKHDRYDSLIEVHESLKFEKEAMLDIQNKMEKADRRSIEILGIFSAIVLFSAGGIQIFHFENITIADAFKFMLCFSYSLVLFVFLIWLITRENIRSVTWVHRIFFIGLTLISYLALAFIINFWPFNQNH